MRLEDRIGEFPVAIPTQAVRQQEERRRQDEWRRTWEAERAAEQARADAIAQERARRQHLEVQAEAWTKSQHVRAFVVAAEARAASRSLSSEERKAFDAWAAWARAHADRLDPLGAALPHEAADPPSTERRRVW